jgi:hypothetical protein
MVSSVELSECVAEALGVPTATVLLHMRNLREEGLLTQGGRGRSSARMTPTDAANLLIAVVGSRNVKDSVKTVNEYGKLLGPLGWDWEKHQPTKRTKNVLLPVPEVIQLVKAHRFTKALAALIESATSGSLERVASETVAEQVNLLLPGYTQKLRIDVTLKGPLPFNEITISHNNQRETHVYAVRRYFLVETETGEHKQLFDPPQPNRQDLEVMDLSFESTFTHRTIMKVGALLRQ